MREQVFKTGSTWWFYIKNNSIVKACCSWTLARSDRCKACGSETLAMQRTTPANKVALVFTAAPQILDKMTGSKQEVLGI